MNSASVYHRRTRRRLLRLVIYLVVGGPAALLFGWSVGKYLAILFG